MSDHNGNSPYNINAFSSREVIRRKKKKIKLGVLFEFTINSQSKEYKTCMVDSAGN